MPSSSTDKRDQRKAELKAEAEALGITYKELKARKKQDKEKKKRKREAEQLQADAELVEGGEGHRDEMKRMRAYSKDFDEVVGASNDGPDEKRRRTRSMDLAEHGKKKEGIDEKKEEKETPKTTAEWRKSHNITIRGHGVNASKKEFPDPFLQFADAPFGDSIQRSLKAAGFAAPTAIQSQVCLYVYMTYNMLLHTAFSPFDFVFRFH